jgi:hypothetical protein
LVCDGGTCHCRSVIYYPGKMFCDNSGNLYFADQNNQRVRKINSAGIITTVAGNGLGSGTYLVMAARLLPLTWVAWLLL